MFKLTKIRKNPKEKMNSVIKVIAIIFLYIFYGVNSESSSPAPNDLINKSSEPDVNITTIPLIQEEASDIVKTVVTNETTSTTNAPLPNTNAVQQEHNNSMAIFFVLCVIALGNVCFSVDFVNTVSKCFLFVTQEFCSFI